MSSILEQQFNNLFNMDPGMYQEHEQGKDENTKGGQRGKTGSSGKRFEPVDVNMSHLHRERYDDGNWF